MAYSSKMGNDQAWEMTVFEIQTRDMYTYPPPPPHPTTHTCPTLRQTYAWLCLISHCIFCSLFLYFCTEFLWQYNAMHKFVRALDNPPPIQEQTSQVSQFWGQSHALTMRHKNLTVNRFTSRSNTLFFKLFCFEKLIFMRQLCRNPQFSGIFISIHHIWSSCWQDKCQIRLSLPVCRI